MPLLSNNMISITTDVFHIGSRAFVSLFLATDERIHGHPSCVGHWPWHHGGFEDGADYADRKKLLERLLP